MAAIIIYPIPYEILERICYEIDETDFCLRLLQSDPRTISTDLPQLSLISTELSKNLSQRTLQTFIEFNKNNTDPYLIVPFKMCVIEFKKIPPNIEAAYQLSPMKHGCVSGLRCRCGCETRQILKK